MKKKVKADEILRMKYFVSIGNNLHVYSILSILWMAKSQTPANVFEKLELKLFQKRISSEGKLKGVLFAKLIREEELKSVSKPRQTAIGKNQTELATNK